VLPGVIDVHTHLRLPTADAPDRFRRDTEAAARGGTTTVLTFNNPGTGISEAGSASPMAGLEEFVRRTEGESVIDYGLNAVITGQQRDAIGELPALIEAGVPTFKAFMVYEFRLPDAELEAAMRVAGRHGGMLQVHCEEPAIIDGLVRDALERGHTACRYHAQTRPARAEASATRKAIEMARRAEAPIYIVHLSCAEALDAVAEAKARGEPIYAETCPHYLTLTEDLYAEPDEAQVIKRVISPPLRTAADRDALWAGLRDGILDVVASDHVPDRVDTEKRVPAPPFPDISNGAPGIETLLSVVYTEGVATGRISLERMVDVLAATPSRLFGLGSKGLLEEGRDADLVVWDESTERVATQASLHHTSDFTPYEGMALRGSVSDVIVGGEPLASARGRFTRRTLS
jgi:dihydropyrimidinase